jgi:hypothetical protein
MQDMQSVNWHIRAFVDQINEGIATLLLGDDESVHLTIPITWLPKGVREGMVLKMGVSIDEEGTKDGKKTIGELMDRLGNEP